METQLRFELKCMSKGMSERKLTKYLIENDEKRLKTRIGWFLIVFNQTFPPFVFLSVIFKL